MVAGSLAGSHAVERIMRRALALEKLLRAAEVRGELREGRAAGSRAPSTGWRSGEGAWDA